MSLLLHSTYKTRKDNVFFYPISIASYFIPQMFHVIKYPLAIALGLPMNAERISERTTVNIALWFPNVGMILFPFAELNVQDDTTTSGSDYTLPASLQVSFISDAQDYADVVFPVAANDDEEGQERFTITLEQPARTFLCQTMTTTTVYISEETSKHNLMRDN